MSDFDFAFLQICDLIIPYFDHKSKQKNRKQICHFRNTQRAHPFGQSSLRRRKVTQLFVFSFSSVCPAIPPSLFLVLPNEKVR